MAKTHPGKEAPSFRGPNYRFINLTAQNAPDTFASDIASGLAAPQKYIRSMHMYDADGSKLFERITQDQDYYPTHAETEILARFAPEIAAGLAENTALVELGSGSAKKTRLLLQALLDKQGHTLFCPIDISGDFLRENVKRLGGDFPSLDVLGIIADYYTGLSVLANEIHQPILMLWLGTDIGHADRNAAAGLLRDKMVPSLKLGDRLLVGIDLKKSAEPIHRAYGCPGDKEPLRYAFNCNALRRINRELGGNFITEKFQRYCFYNEALGRVETYLKSLCHQQVTVASLGQSFDFKEGELVHIHFAYKYDQDDILQLGKAAGLKLEQQWFDEKAWYSLNLFSVGQAGNQPHARLP